MKRIIAMLLVLFMFMCSVRLVSAVSLDCKKRIVMYNKHEDYSFKLKVRHAKKKVEWSVSDKKHLSIKKGKVKIKKKGNYVIYAKVGKKKLKCKVKVLSITSFYKLCMKSYRQIKKQFNGIKYKKEEIGEYEVKEHGESCIYPIHDLKSRKQAIKQLNKIRKNKIANVVDDCDYYAMSFNDSYKKLCKKIKVLQKRIKELDSFDEKSNDYYDKLCKIELLNVEIYDVLYKELGESICGYSCPEDKWIGIKAWRKRF